MATRFLEQVAPACLREGAALAGGDWSHVDVLGRGSSSHAGTVLRYALASHTPFTVSAALPSPGREAVTSDIARRVLLLALSPAWARSAAEDVSKDVVVVPGTLPAAGNATALPHGESAAAPPPAVPATAAVCPLAACSPAVLQIAHSTFEIPWENDCTLPLRLLQMAAAAAARCS